MVTSKWFKDSCPYCKDQGFDSVVGDVESGESVIGFQHTMSGSITGGNVYPLDTIAFADQTLTSKGKVTQFADTDYKVFVTRAGSGTTTGTYGVPGVQADVSAQKNESFGFQGNAGQAYDIIVRGRILY